MTGSLPLESGKSVPVVGIVGNYQGTWRLENGAAVSDLPVRTVQDASKLFDAIALELERGPLPPAEPNSAERIYPLGVPAS